MTQPRASVVVPMYNAASHVREQVEALASQSYSPEFFEVIFVDNGSTDATVAIVSNAIQSSSHMHLIRAEALPTSFHARNAGAHAALGDQLLFCDADDVVDRHWVKQMVDALAEHEVVGGRLEFDLLNPHAGAIPSTSSIEVYHEFLPTAFTSNLGIQRAVFDALGGFREQSLSGQDVGLCWRAQLSGYSLGFAPDAIVHFRLRRTTVARFARQFRSGWRYRSWATEFISSGLESPSPTTALRRVIGHSWAAAVRAPRRPRAGAAAWNLGVFYSFVHLPQLRRGSLRWARRSASDRPDPPATPESAS